MKRKASIAALDDLYESILKDALLGGLERKKDKQTPLEDLDLEDSEDDSEDSEDMGEGEEIKPKVVEFSVTRLGKFPNSSKKEPKIDLKGGVKEQFSSKKKHKKRR